MVVLRIMMRLFVGLFVFAFPCLVLAQNDVLLIGQAQVVDGDTLYIGSTKIRLQGADAPETDQVCLDSKAKRWTCGIVARDKLSEHIDSRKVSCKNLGLDNMPSPRTLGACTVNGEDLNAWLVREGWALAYVKYSRAYIEIEREARNTSRGL